MSKTISLTLDIDHSSLTRASEMLAGMAADLVSPFTSEERAELDAPKAEAMVAAPIVEMTEPDAKAIFSPKPEASSSASTAPVQESAPPAETTANSALTVETPEPAPSAAAGASVDLDSDGLPWDERIHSSNKGKLKKTEQWKKKRGISDEVVEQVETELRAVMAIPAAPVTETAPPPAATSAETAPPPAAPVTETAPPPAAGPITTFPELMSAITKAHLTQEQINAGLTATKVPALAVVATRPDLIPGLAKALGL